MDLHTRFTQAFGLTTPIALAPMALASGGALSAACAQAGALGLLGGGYGELEWTLREHRLALQTLRGQPEALARLGCGFITWRLDQDASALDAMLAQAHRPAAIMLSFGDPRPYRERLQAAGVPLMCQVQNLAQIPWASEAGAAVLVVQGMEAGGHGMNALQGRGTFALVPEAADWLAAHAPHTLLLAAGGVADGRGVAAALALGADGALIGSAKEATLCEGIAAPVNAAQAEKVRNLAGHTDLLTAMDVIASARAVVSNDSGLMHVAAAFGVAQVALFGSSSPEHTPPLNTQAQVLWLARDAAYTPALSCAPCFERQCPLGHTRCLTDIRPERVRQALGM